eukprot:CAMPEP_0176169530 /NCGR_PEP_ID=MMETSP0120_2-20121206/86782_1 /TAXON_ID=160619 /ORGANISM="Kryptoperidinium foliaceum, Strain CCMP 1326" /LENGTH=182 /DNA_ID=CAMNT_0017507297 /DNA_START=23 /DNA_END=572 /DNA_ORIENTATION=-
MSFHPISMRAVAEALAAPRPCTLPATRLVATAATAAADGLRRKREPIAKLLREAPRLDEVDEREAQPEVVADGPLLRELQRHPLWVVAEDAPLGEAELSAVHSGAPVLHLDGDVPRGLAPTCVLADSACDASLLGVVAANKDHARPSSDRYVFSVMKPGSPPSNVIEATTAGARRSKTNKPG